MSCDVTPQQQFFQRHYDSLRETCLASRNLFVDDADRLLVGLAQSLSQFRGTTDEQFLEWATAILRPAADKLSRFCKLKSDSEKVVKKGIWSVLQGATDLGIDGYTLQDLVDETWLWAFENLDDLLAPGTAATSTRLYKKAYWFARAWKTAQLRARKRFVAFDSLEAPDSDEQDAA